MDYYISNYLPYIFSRKFRIRIQHFKRIRIQSGSRVLITKNCRTKIQQKFVFLSFFIKNCNLLTSNVQATREVSALKREHSALQKKKFFFYVCGSFLPSWIRIANPDTDPGTPLNSDPQHWYLGSVSHPDLIRAQTVLRVQEGKITHRP